MRKLSVFIFVFLISMLLCCCSESDKTISGNGWTIDESGTLSGNGWTANEDGTISGNGWTIDESGTLSGNGWYIDENGVLTGRGDSLREGWHINESGLPCDDDNAWWLNELGQIRLEPVIVSPGLQISATCLSESGSYKADFIGYERDINSGKLTITLTDGEEKKSVTGDISITKSDSDDSTYYIDFTPSKGSVIEGFMIYDSNQKTVTQLYDIDPVGGANTVYYEKE